MSALERNLSACLHVEVEELRKQMYLSGQGKSTDFLSTAAEASAATSHLNHSEKAELKQAIAEQQKRRLKLKRAAQAQAAAAEKAEKAEEGSDEEEGMPSSASPVDRSFAKSRRVIEVALGQRLRCEHDDRIRRK